ncbi:MAG: hypothetical protein ACRD1A_11030 [Terriglobales bacterium]
MPTAFIPCTVPHWLSRHALTVALLPLLGAGLAAQSPAAPSVTRQRQAMRKLAYLAGRWSGPISIVKGPGAPLQFTQTEDVQFKLDGLVLLIEGQSTDAQGKVEFSALATVAFDDATRTYHFRAYNDGRYLDTKLDVTAGGFSWSYTAGPARIVNTMHLTPGGDWKEVTEVTVGGRPPQPSVSMLLTRLPQHQP